jgi:hypothetical protein
MVLDSIAKELREGRTQISFQTDAKGQAWVPLSFLKGRGYIELQVEVALHDEEGEPVYMLRRFMQATQPIWVGTLGPHQGRVGRSLTLHLQGLTGPSYTALAKGVQPIRAEVWQMIPKKSIESPVSKQLLFRTKVKLFRGRGHMSFVPLQEGWYEVLLWAPAQKCPTIHSIRVSQQPEADIFTGFPGRGVSMKFQDSAVEAGRPLRLLVRATLPGKVLFTIEGTQVWYHRWVDLSEGTTQIELPITPECAPGVHVRVVVFHDVGRERRSFQPSWDVGYVPVYRPQGLAALTLTVPSRARAGEPIRLRIRAPQHPKAHILLTAVDEATWQRQDVKPSFPEAVFYRREQEGPPFMGLYPPLGQGVVCVYPSEDNDEDLVDVEFYEGRYVYEELLQLR